MHWVGSEPTPVVAALQNSAGPGGAGVGSLDLRPRSRETGRSKWEEALSRRPQWPPLEPMMWTPVRPSSPPVNVAQHPPHLLCFSQQGAASS